MEKFHASAVKEHYYLDEEKNFLITVNRDEQRVSLSSGYPTLTTVYGANNINTEEEAVISLMRRMRDHLDEEHNRARDALNKAEEHKEEMSRRLLLTGKTLRKLEG